MLGSRTMLGDERSMGSVPVGVGLKAVRVHVVAAGILLQLAATALIAGQAVGAVAAHEQLQRRAAAVEHLFRVGVDDHAVARLHGAGRVHLAAVILDKAQTAAAVDGQVFTVAKRGDVDAVVAGRPRARCARS